MVSKYFISDVNTYLQNILPKDAFCVCGLSWYDFYPSQELNHILGEGTLEHGTAAFTFGHYAMYKEREFFSASNWKSEYTLSKPCNVSSELSMGDGADGFFDFVTENEKEEAKLFTLECDQESCAGSKLVNSPSKERKMSLRMFSPKKRTISNSSYSTNNSTFNDGDCSDDTNVEQQNGRSKEREGALMSAAYDEATDPALAPNTTFDLNCKIQRRLFRVCMETFISDSIDLAKQFKLLMFLIRFQIQSKTTKCENIRLLY